ncbi:WD40/YVTN/BNR-like repeat-containing protein [Haladaptatus sp. CMAA 1911]|uniref:WD40/YVTN/BNR-like repeat-containing protein n=1 Tax=unclassified Haladaptatus TaxID=2622732 RepID=UPI003754CB9F
MPTYFATMENCVIEISKRDGHWQIERHLEDISPLCIVSTSNEYDTVYVGTLDDSLYRSTDGGISWETVGGEIDSNRITALATDRNGRIWAGTEPSRIYQSEDSGETWTEKSGISELPSAADWSYPPRPETHNVRWIEPDPTDSDRVFICIEQGALVQTTDGGETWIDRVPESPRDIHQLRMHAAAPGRLYAATGDGAEQPGKGYAESHDHGETWSYPNDGMEKQYLTCVAVDAVNPDRVLVSASTTPKQTDDFDALSSAVYRRLADGSWEKCMSGLPNGAGLTPPMIATSEQLSGRFIAIANRGLFRTDDYGDSWEEITVEWPVEFTEQHPRAIALVEW